MLGYANISARVSPLWIAREKGFFSKYGVQLQAVYMPGAPALFATLGTGQIQVANSGGSTALGAVVGGLDLKVLGTFTSRIPFDIVASPAIKDGKDLRGKRLGIQAIGGTIWMAGLLGLEYLGLDPRRDSIQVVAAGEQMVLTQALEKGTVDAVVVDSAFSNTLKARGFSIVAELSKSNIPFVSNGIVARANFLQQQPDLARNIIKGWMEGVAFALSPKMKPAVIASIMRNLKINDAELAERGYQDLLQVTDRKPFPSLEGLRNVQRLMAQRNPAVGNLKTENLIDGRIIRELDESGFIDQLYAAYAVK
jgi:NitT/TauT family transport system substrate-binding protein